MPEVLKQLPDKSLLGLFPDYLAIEYGENADVELPVELISRFSDYKFYLSKFCKSDEDNLLPRLISPVFRRVNAHLVKKTGKCIFQLFKPENITKQNRLPFANALYYGEVKTVTIEQYSYAGHLPLRSFFTAVVKHTENKLRELKGFRGRLKGYNLDNDVKIVIDSFVSNEFKMEESAKKHVKIEVDREKILQLIHDSNVVQQRLLSGTEQEDDVWPDIAGDMDRHNSIQMQANTGDTAEINLADGTAAACYEAQDSGAATAHCKTQDIGVASSHCEYQNTGTDAVYHKSPDIDATDNEDGFAIFIDKLSE